MLINLHVKNLALIEEAEVDFTDHLNILTGETGAGKSILIGSIQSALGGKIPKDMIREGADSALIELVFHTETQAVLQKLDELEIPSEDGEVVISRRVTNRRVINKINDITISLPKLKELSPLLLDLSGQHENQILLKPQNHLLILDNYAKDRVTGLKKEIADLFHSYRSLRKELDSQDIGEEERLREMEFLRYEISEIESARLQPGEDEDLEQEYHKISHSREILEDCGYVHDSLSEDQSSASSRIGRALQRLNSVANLDGDASDLCEQLGTIDALLGDFNRDLADYIDSMEFDEETFQEIAGRLDLINHLKAKYGDSIPGILDYCQANRERCHKLENYEEYLAGLRRKADQARERLEKACDRLSALRKEAAGPLAEAIRTALTDLNFSHVSFEIAFEKTAYSVQGNDGVCFMISTNPGQPIRPLHEIASGGELSRIMLAIKSILADAEGIESLIFDEIDTGISGRTAQKVSEKLKQIAGGRQVIAITHLPQIAAMADSHYLIEKTSDNVSTISSIRKLDDDQAVEELARMLGGTKITDAVRKNAREMRELAASIQ